nr:MAG TPA: hypothetical protein [Caudoviricetes sp.]
MEYQVMIIQLIVLKTMRNDIQASSRFMILIYLCYSRSQNRIYPIYYIKYKFNHISIFI